MKSIKLSDGQKAFVDDEDFDRLNKYEWHPIFMNGSYHAFRFVMVDGEGGSSVCDCWISV